MPSQQPVRDIMTSPVVTLEPDTSVEDALSLLASKGISGAPVVAADGSLVGLVDDSDLIVSEARLHGPTVIEVLGAYIPLPGEQRRVSRELRHVLAQTVSGIMHDKPPSVSVDGTLGDVATAMVDHQVSRVPIVDTDGKVVGIVTRGDIVHAMGTS